MIKKKRLGQSVLDELSEIQNPRKKSELLRSFLVESQSIVITEKSEHQNFNKDRKSRSIFKAKKKSKENLDVNQKTAQLKSKIRYQVKNVDYGKTTRGASKDEIPINDWQWWKNELLEKHLKGVEKRSKEKFVEDQDCKRPLNRTSVDSMKEHFKPKKQSLMIGEKPKNMYNSRIQCQTSKPTTSKSMRRVQKHKTVKNVNMETHEKVNDKRIKERESQRQANVLSDENFRPSKFNSRDIPKPIPNHDKDDTKYKPNNNMKRGPQESFDLYSMRERIKENPNNPRQNRRDPKSNTTPGPVPIAKEATRPTSAYHPGIVQGVSYRNNNFSQSNHIRPVISVNHLVKLDQSVLSHIDKNRELEEYARHLKSKWGQSMPHREMDQSRTDVSRGGDADALKYLYISDGKGNRTPSKVTFTSKKSRDPTAPLRENLKSLQSGLEEDYRLQRTRDWTVVSASHQSSTSHHQQHPRDAEEDTCRQRSRYPSHRRTLPYRQETQIVNRCGSIQTYTDNKAHPSSSELETPRKHKVNPVKASFMSQRSRSRISSEKTERSAVTTVPYYNEQKSESAGTYDRRAPPTRSTYRRETLYTRISQASVYSGESQNSSGSKVYLKSISPNDDRCRDSSRPVEEQGMLTYDSWNRDRSTRSCYVMGLQTSAYAGGEHSPPSSTDTPPPEKKLSPHLEQLIENVKSIGEQYYKFSSRTMIPVLRQVQNNFICRFCNLRQYLQTYVESLEKSAQEYVETHEAKRRRVSVSPPHTPHSRGATRESLYPRCLPCGCKVVSSPRNMCCCNVMCCNRCACNMCMCYYNRNRA